MKTKKYILNVGTHTIHVEGFCHYVSPGIRENEVYRRFASEEEAVAFDYRATLCKKCLQKRNQLVAEEGRK